MNLASHIARKVVHIFRFFAIIFVLNGCSKDSESYDAGIKVTSFEVIQDGDTLIFTYTTTGDVAYIEILKSTLPSGGTSGATVVATSSNGTAQVYFKELGLKTGDVATFYIRAVGTNDRLSAVIGPKVITINTFCDIPNNLHVENGNFSWFYYPSSPLTYYEIEYGPQGFVKGDGTKMNANGGSTNDFTFVGGEVYDIYIRGYCSRAQGFSLWAGPVSYLAKKNQNLCLEPTNVSYSVEYNYSGEPIGVRIRWDDPGNTGDYEYNLAANNESPTSNLLESGNSTTIQYFTLTKNIEYDFYVRTKCIEGTTTEWVGPLDVIIGN